MGPKKKKGGKGKKGKGKGKGGATKVTIICALMRIYMHIMIPGESESIAPPNANPPQHTYPNTH
jgi:hypothetical protein